MREKLINFNTAKLACEKGFTENVDFCYDSEEKDIEDPYVHNIGDLSGDEELYAPTQGLLQKWLRETHKINVYCLPCEHDESLWYNNIASQIPVFTGTYEEAVEIGLFEGLKLIK